MSTVLNNIFQITKSAYALLTGTLLFFCYYFFNKSSSLKQDNKVLLNEIEEMTIEAKKIITIQAKQIDIASKPALSRDLIHKWMRSNKNTD
jgi:hypothetical protein